MPAESFTRFILNQLSTGEVCVTELVSRSIQAGHINAKASMWATLRRLERSKLVIRKTIKTNPGILGGPHFATYWKLF